MKKSSKRSNNSGATRVEILIIFIILSILLTIVVRFKTFAEKELPASYAAWVKHTGNPHHLTFEEWKALTNADHREYYIRNRDY